MPNPPAEPLDRTDRDGAAGKADMPGNTDTGASNHPAPEPDPFDRPAARGPVRPEAYSTEGE